ncbi:hypothetical protein [Rhodothermus profundi]|uniref:Uncharacterized protein n=1 Tax=Rhodothermus profundi TaxID=633813 RepID=A0A1M6UU35_9BACT|nr:hypothetical protein [Rhodothermus profundi]SHK72611.1 hypothetical protein SAMN04488087_1860 [Rhodothermus profundi]
MRRRFFPYRLLALLLNVTLMGPLLPWAAWSVLDSHRFTCHHMICPHQQQQQCTCHRSEETPRWQHCHDEAATMPGSASIMPYGPLPIAVTWSPPSAGAPVALADPDPPAQHPVTDIFHPPRRKPASYGLS